MAARASGRVPPSPPALLRVVMVAMPTSEAIDVVATLDILLLANNALRSGGGRGTGYAMEVVAATPGAISRWAGLTLSARRPYRDVRGSIDTLVVGSVDDPNQLTRDVRLVRRPDEQRILLAVSGSHGHAQEQTNGYDPASDTPHKCALQ
jgi:transcriptional regulator GlxA family with amidase domain